MKRIRRAARVCVLAFGAAACGLKGGAPSVRPPAPVGALVVEGRDGAVRVRWESNPLARIGGSRVASFDVLRREEDPSERNFFVKVGSVPAGDGAATTHLFVDPAPPADAQLVYRVRARASSEPPTDQEAYSGPQEAIHWVPPLPPPRGVQAVPLHLSVRLSWNPVDGANGYRVYTLDSAGVASAEPVNRGTLDRTNFVVFGLVDGKPVRLAVRSVRIEAVSPPTAAPTPALASDASGGRQVPPAPSGNEVGGAAEYGISIPASEVPETFKRLAAAVTGEGPLPGVESVSSTVLLITPGLTEPPPAPRQLKLAITATGIALSWRPSSGEQVVGYHVERREPGTRKPIDVFQRRTTEPVAGTGYLDTDVKKGVSYEYQVRAIDESGTEGRPTESKTITFTP
jgi:hypothetical protein